MSNKNKNVSPDRKIIEVVRTSVVINQDEGIVSRSTSVRYSHSPINEVYSDSKDEPEEVKKFCLQAPNIYERDAAGIISRWIYSYRPRVLAVKSQIRCFLDDVVPQLASDNIVSALRGLNAMVLDENTGIYRELPSTVVEDTLKLIASIQYGVKNISYEVLLPYHHRGRLTITACGTVEFELITNKEEIK